MLPRIDKKSEHAVIEGVIYSNRKVDKRRFTLFFDPLNRYTLLQIGMICRKAKIGALNHVWFSHQLKINTRGHLTFETASIVWQNVLCFLLSKFHD